MKKKYLGKTCPFCKTKFTESDSVVFCSACEMPHHLPCWETNQGCTTFGCTGSMGDIIKPKLKSTSPVNAREIKPSINTNNVPTSNSVLTTPKPSKRECVFRHNRRVLQPNSCILIDDVSLFIDYSKNTEFLRTTFRSLSNNPITKIFIDVALKDDNKQNVPGISNYLLDNIIAKRDMQFGQNMPIRLSNTNAREAYVVIRQIVFENGEIMTPQMKYISIPTQKTLIDELGDHRLVDLFIQNTSDYSNYFPAFGSWGWECSCGRINLALENSCSKCGIEKSRLEYACENREISQSSSVIPSTDIRVETTNTDVMVETKSEGSHEQPKAEVKAGDTEPARKGGPDVYVEKPKEKWTVDYVLANIFGSDVESDYDSISKYCSYNVHFGVNSETETEGMFTAVTYWPTGETTQINLKGSAGIDLCVNGSWSSPSDAPDGDIIVALYDPDGKRIATKQFYYG